MTVKKPLSKKAVVPKEPKAQEKSVEPKEPKDQEKPVEPKVDFGTMYGGVKSQKESK